MTVLLANNATSRLASSLTAAATTLSVTAGQGSRFPSPSGDQWFPLTLIKASGVLEIVKCTVRLGDVFTIVRAQESTAAMSFEAGDRVELRATAGVFTEGQQKTAEAKQDADAAQQAADNAQSDADTLDGLAVKKDANTTTGAAKLPGGTQDQRPASPANGMFRYNSEKHQFEGYQNGKWGQVGGGDHVLSIKWEASRNNIGDGGVAADGQTLSRATYPDAWSAINAGKVPVVDDAEWLSDPTKRGCFSRGDGSTTFRLPDYNGKSSGSLGAVFLRGDGALSAEQAGLIQRDAMQGHRHSGSMARGGVEENLGGATRYIQTSNTGDPVSDGVNGTPRTSSETRPLNVTGVWVVKLFGAVVNVGSADAAQLASDYANLAAAVQTLEARYDSEVDFTIIYPNGGSEASPAVVATNSRYVEDNPFPGHAVICEAQIYTAVDGWHATGWYSSTTSGVGVRAAQCGDDVVVAVGNVGISFGYQYAGGSSSSTGGSGDATPRPCRVRVWKVKGAVA